MATLTAADQSFAVAITLRHFFEPLYKDYSVIGRIFGIVFRTFRVVIGGVLYLFIALVFADRLSCLARHSRRHTFLCRKKPLTTNFILTIRACA